LFGDIPVAGFVKGIELTTYMEVGLLYEGYQVKFTEPFEVAYFIFKSGIIIKFTNNVDGTVRGLNLRDTFEELGLRFEDLVIVIHNHRYPHLFSIGDKRFYSDLKRRGFNGSFLLYISPTKKVYELK